MAKQPVVDKNKEEKKTDKELQNALGNMPKSSEVAGQAINFLARVVAYFRPGSWLIRHYEASHHSKIYPRFHRATVFAGWALDFCFSAFFAGLMAILAVGFVYVVLRGVNAWNEVVHLYHYIFS